MRSVFARRCRRDTAIDVASTTWLSIQSSRFSNRSIQNPVQTRLLDHHQRIEFSFACLRLLAEVCKAGKQGRGIAAGHHMTGNLLASRCQRRYQPGRFAEFQRDEDCAKVDPDSRHVRLINCHKHDWPPRGMLSDPFLPRCRSLSTPHGILGQWRLRHELYAIRLWPQSSQCST